MTNNEPLRDNPIYKETLAIAEVMYGLLDKLVEDFPEEKWASASKLRNAANDSLYYMSQAVGNALPETSAYDWSNVRKHLFSLQAMYIFAGKQHFFALDPDIVIRIDKLIQQADENVVTANSLRAANAHQE